MGQYSYTSSKLPDEIIFFKDLIDKKTDPIKKYMFNLKELKYIMKNISKFSVPYKSFSKIYSLKDNDRLLEFLTYIYSHNYNINYMHYKYIKEFIYIFFDYDNPVYSNYSYDDIWIYPRLDIQDFISDSFFEYNFKDTKNNVYLNEASLNKLLTIITCFTKYEYSSLEDEEISYLFDGVNYPSLVLANIDLYEKGYIEVVEEVDEIKIFLNKEKKETCMKDTSIFGDNRELLKTHILEFINSDSYMDNITDKKYSLNDFL